ncbi:MAG: LPS export ABC transporter periplasmic protein LptC [Candidatus Aminicenantes bacterium]|nr:LPS export ABC transporter periplasmic protein LptC [Candidatus Aminicenantes bacterium]
MKLREYELTKGLRWIIAAALIIIILFIALYFFSHSGKRNTSSSGTAGLSGIPVKKHENIRHREFKEGQGKMQLKADRHYADFEETNSKGEPEKYYLEGNVEIIDFSKSEGNDIIISGDKGVYDKDWKAFILTGKVHVRQKDLIVQSTEVRYNREKNIFQTDKGIDLSSKRVTGNADSVLYDMGYEEIELWGNVNIHIRREGDAKYPLDVASDHLKYWRKQNRGLLTGNVHLEYGPNSASADSAEFELFLDRKNLRHLYLKGNAFAEFYDEESMEKAKDDETVMFSSSSHREIRAGRMKFQAFLNEAKIHAFEAEEDCRMIFYYPSGKETNIQSDFTRLVFNRDQKLMEFIATGKVHLNHQGENPQKSWSVSGEKMYRTGNGKTLVVESGKTQDAVISFSDREISSGLLTIWIESRDLEAVDGVRLVIKPRDEQNEGIGYFSSEQPLFIVSRKMSYSEENAAFLFEGDVKIWQEKGMLQAGKLNLIKETGRIQCTEEVTSVLPFKRRENEQEMRITIESGEMDFDPDLKKMTFETKSRLTVNDVQMTADSLSLIFKENDREMDKIEALGKVVISQSGYEGRGGKAVYSFAEEKIVLTENPILIEKNRGSSRGDKLTFYIADGKIAVENKDRERSTTIIKK